MSGARTRDAIVDDVVSGVASLQATAASLLMQPPCESRIVSLERHLVGLSVLVSDLRQHVATVHA